MSRFADRYPELVALLKAAYREPHRAYHTWDHIAALLVDYVRLADRFACPEAVETALYWHDAIYQPRAKDNEAESAAWMIREMMGKADTDCLRHAEAIILATATHRIPDGADAALSRDCALFLDMDLAILGAPEAAFDAYDEAIREEFKEIPDQFYLTGRKTIMEGFLRRERLYLTDDFHASHDAPARANLTRLIERLSTSL